MPPKAARMPNVKIEPSISESSQTSTTNEDVVQEPNNAAAIRLLFYQDILENLEHCAGRMKNAVKHMELNYRSNEEASSPNGASSIYDGLYTGEDLDKCNLRKHAVGCFKSGRFYIMPLQESYTMNRKIYRPKSVNVQSQAKLDDERLGQLDSDSIAKASRVAFVRNETDWQKKRRETSAVYKKQLFDTDPWIDLNVQKSTVKNVFASEIKESAKYKSAVVKNGYELPEL